MVKMETLYQPIRSGRKNLLDIKSRNKAIYLSWLRDYMKLRQGRLAWTFIADELIRWNVRTTDKVKDLLEGQNQILQTWKAKMRRMSTLPKDIKKMLKTGKRNGVKVWNKNLSNKAKIEMPIWHYLGLSACERKEDSTRRGKHPRKTYSVITVGNTCKIVTRLFGRNHKHNTFCKCGFCQADVAQLLKLAQFSLGISWWS